VQHILKNKFKPGAICKSNFKKHTLYCLSTFCRSILLAIVLAATFQG